MSSLHCGASLDALSVSPDGTKIAVGGREVYKIIQLTNDYKLKELRNLRIGRANTNYTVVDLAWNPISAHYIATAPTNGAVVLWNLNSQRRMERVFTEHTRTVNKVCWRPTDAALLLSGSQDGTVKLWDIRQGASAATFSCGAEVRAMVTSPQYKNFFAAGLDTGLIQIWDIRNREKAFRQIAAHLDIIFSLDFDPINSKYLVSGGRDRLIKIWDLTDPGTRPKEVIQTITTVGCVKWRPGYPNQITSTANMVDSGIHIWDIKSSFVPLYSFKSHRDVVTGFSWCKHDPKYIFSCSKDAHLCISNISNATKPHNDICTTPIGWDAYHKLATVLDTIPREPTNEATEAPLFSPEKHGEIRIYQDRYAKITESRQEEIIYLAKHYKFYSGTIEERCDNNAKRAYEVQRYQLAKVWQMLKLLYSIKKEKQKLEQNCNITPTESPTPKTGELFNSSPPAESDSIPDETLTHEDTLHYLQHAPTLSYDSFNEEEYISSPSFVVVNDGTMEDIIEPDYDEVILETLDFYSNMGDVQTCVAIVAVFGNNIKLDERRVLEWHYCYIELLRRLKQFSMAAEIIKYCPYTAINSMNQSATTIHTNCGICGKKLHQLESSCPKCATKTHICSICHLPVRGEYIWFQECGHGGHAEHLIQWYKKYPYCPTCGKKNFKNYITK